jgi:hypothetical protein
LAQRHRWELLPRRLPSYPGWYDKFLLAVSLLFNVLTVWYAWKWI